MVVTTKKTNRQSNDVSESSTFITGTYYRNATILGRLSYYFLTEKKLRMINAGNGEWEMKNREREMGRGKKKGKLGMENGIGIFFLRSAAKK